MSDSILNFYHDAELDSVTSGDSAGEVSLRFKLADGGRSSLLFSGCEMFRVQDYVSQNVVSRVIIYSGNDFKDSDIVRTLKWASSLSDSPTYLSDETTRDILAGIKSGKQSLFYLEPSYGAEVAILFRQMSVQPNEGLERP